MSNINFFLMGTDWKEDGLTLQYCPKCDDFRSNHPNDDSCFSCNEKMLRIIGFICEGGVEPK